MTSYRFIRINWEKLSEMSDTLNDQLDSGDQRVRGMIADGEDGIVLLIETSTNE